MGLKSFKREEDAMLVTLPNVLTSIRAIGGVLIGILLAGGHIASGVALLWAVILAATDVEGFVIQLAKRAPRLQQALRIIPSRFGRAADPIVDKIFTTSIFLGGTVGGEIPLWQAIAILVVEAATSLATISVARAGGRPETSKSGSWGMVARCGTIACDLGAAAVTNNFAQHTLIIAGAALAIIAVVLGSISCWKIYRTPIKP